LKKVFLRDGGNLPPDARVVSVERERFRRGWWLVIHSRLFQDLAPDCPPPEL
jgi:hypothetical protein